MARRGFSRVSRGGIKPPQRQIFNLAIDGEMDNVGLLAATNVKALGSFVVAIVDDPVTLVRTRGEVGINVSVAAAARANIQGAFGMYVITSDANAIGITAIPGPLSDSQNDWFVWVPFTMHVLAALDEAGIGQHVRIPFDSRGMRKLKDGDILAVVVEATTDVAAPALDVNYSFRQQFKI